MPVRSLILKTVQHMTLTRLSFDVELNVKRRSQWPKYDTFHATLAIAGCTAHASFGDPA